MNAPIVISEANAGSAPLLQGDIPMQEAFQGCIARAMVIHEQAPLGPVNKKGARQQQDALQRKTSISSRSRSRNAVLKTPRRSSLKHREWNEPEPPALPEAARSLEDDKSIAVPFAFDLTPGERHIGVIAHIFYPEIAHEVRRLIDNIPGFGKLYVSTCSESAKALIQAILSNYPPIPAEIRVVENRGRDIASKTTIFRDVFGAHDLLLFLHSKESRHSGLLRLWRHYLFETLAGTPEHVKSVLTMFEADPRLGMIAPQHFEPMRQFVNWGGNFPAVSALLKRLGHAISRERPLDFPSGSMFWVRPEAMKALCDLDIGMDEYLPENNRKDGTLAHAVERAFYHLCEAADYRWIKIAVPAFCPETPAILEAGSRTKLKETMDETSFSLLSSSPREKIRAPLATHIRQPAKALTQHIANQTSGRLQRTTGDRRIAMGIVTHQNNERQLAKGIAAARLAAARSKLTGSYLIFVMHNGGPIPVPMGEDIVVLPNEVNLGFGAAHNTMMQEAFHSGFDAYLTLNPDGALHPDAMDHLIAAAYSSSADALVEALQFPCEHPKVYDEYTRETSWVSGACLLITRRVHQLTNGFDQGFFMYCEDVDLSWRARASGIRLKTCPQAWFLHETSNREMSASTLSMILHSTCRLAQKWRQLPLEHWARDLAEERHVLIKEQKGVEPVPEHWLIVPSIENMTAFSPKRW